MKLEPVLLAAALVLAATSASAAEKAKPAGPRCLAPDQIAGHKIADARTLYLKGGGFTWRADMATNCLGGVKSSDPLMIGASPAATGGICEPADLNVQSELGGGGLPVRCRVDTFTRLTPAQAAALAKDLQP
jgi:hypothetical protein